MNPHILLVDDDQALCELLGEYLQSEGFAVDSVQTGKAALQSLSPGHNYAAVVLDIMMPGMSGLDVLRELRNTQQQVPVLMLTGRGDDIDRIVGLELGADDYLGKPCNPRELTARIKAVLRRTQPQSAAQTGSGDVLHLHGIEIDPGRRSAHANGQELKLTSAEFNTLHLLMQSAGQVLSKQQLTESVLNRKLEAYDRSMDVHISRLRNKLSQAGIDDPIKAIRGAGYQMLTETL